MEISNEEYKKYEFYIEKMKKCYDYSVKKAEEDSKDALYKAYVNVTKDTNVILKRTNTDEQFDESRFSENIKRVYEKITDADIQKEFIEKFSNENLIENFENGINEVVVNCPYFLNSGRENMYRIVLVLMRNPDTFDVEGILYGKDNAMEYYHEKMAEYFLCKSYDSIGVISLQYDELTIFTQPGREEKEYFSGVVPYIKGCFMVADSVIVPEDREEYLKASRPDTIIDNLEDKEEYSFVIKAREKDGEIRLKRFSYCYIDRLRQIVLSIMEDFTNIIGDNFKEV